MQLLKVGNAVIAGQTASASMMAEPLSFAAAAVISGYRSDQS
jgi:hypothetical protein